MSYTNEFQANSSEEWWTEVNAEVKYEDICNAELCVGQSLDQGDSILIDEGFRFHV